MSLAALTYGTRHVFDPVPPLPRVANQLKARFKIEPNDSKIVVDVPEPCGAAWIRVRNVPGYGPFGDFDQVIVEDSHGCPFPADPEIFSGG